MEKSLESHALEVVLESSNLPDSEKNLRRKVDSIIRTIENLSAKKLNLELEIKTQKRVLARKRSELKKRSKPIQAKLKLAIESSLQIEEQKDLNNLRIADQQLLRESARVLEE